MSKKILYISNKSKGVGSFCLSSLLAAKELGFEFHYAADFSEADGSKLEEDERVYGVKFVNVPIQRTPFSLKNAKAFFLLVKYVKEHGIDYIHCNTPVGGLLGRLVGAKCHVKRVIYQAHGFHFYKGAKVINWLLFYPIEKWLSLKTDILITINTEDFELAKKKMKAKSVVFIPGVGIDVDRITNVVVNKDEKRASLGIPRDAFVILSVGFLNKNKNHRLVVKALGRLGDKNIHYVIAGEGKQRRNLERLARKYGVNLHLLGFRKDVLELYKISNLYVHPSFREGLPISVMEAAASDCDCLCSNVRGCRDIVSSDVFDPRDFVGLSDAISGFRLGLITNKSVLFQKSKMYDLRGVTEQMLAVYRSLD